MKLTNATIYSTTDIRRLVVAIARQFGDVDLTRLVATATTYARDAVTNGRTMFAAKNRDQVEILLPIGQPGVTLSLPFGDVRNLALAVRDLLCPTTEDSVVDVVLDDVPMSLWALHAMRSPMSLRRGGLVREANDTRRAEIAPKRVMALFQRVVMFEQLPPSPTRDASLARARKLLAFWQDVLARTTATA